jgi:hypothetical protein
MSFPVAAIPFNGDVAEKKPLSKFKLESKESIPDTAAVVLLIA